MAGERGSPDTWRDPRGFALKFYTSEGNYDMVGNNTPVFFLRDPMKFQHFIRSQKRRADSDLRDHDMQWDFWSLSPESAHQVTLLMGDRGIPRSWRHMNGYSSHTYMWVNAKGERFWVKYHFKTDQGIECLTQEDADRIAGEDGDYHRRDLFDAIRRGDYPTWTLRVQIMPFEEARAYRFNPFDLTKVWPHGDYPLHEVGRLTLDRNPTDFHAEIEQAAFEPNNLVPGIGVSPDKMLLARVFSYADAHRARMGVNYKQIPVNAPQSAVHSYSKDGAMRMDKVADPVYAPNSKGGPAADPERYPYVERWDADGEFVHAAYTLHRDDDDWGQAGTLVREVMDDAQRDRLVSNVVGHLSQGVTPPVLERAARVLAQHRQGDRRPHRWRRLGLLAAAQAAQCASGSVAGGNDPMEAVLGLEVTDPDVLDVFDVLGAQIGLTGPFLHLCDPLGRSLHLIRRERLEFLMTRHDGSLRGAHIPGHGGSRTGETAALPSFPLVSKVACYRTTSATLGGPERAGHRQHTAPGGASRRRALRLRQRRLLGGGSMGGVLLNAPIVGMVGSQLLARYAARPSRSKLTRAPRPGGSSGPPRGPRSGSLRLASSRAAPE